MLIKWVFDRNRDVVAVIPTMEISSVISQNLAKELDSFNVDSLFVQNRGTTFSFANSMNQGINEVLKRPFVKYIILSNDDISKITGLEELLKALDEKKADYAQPFVNGQRGSLIFTSSVVRAMLNWGIRKRAPLYALRIISMIRKINKNKKFLISAPAIFKSKGIVRVQPFAVFKREILEKHRFDENLINGAEDDDFAYTLWKENYKGISKKEWGVVHASNLSFKQVNPKSKTGGFYGSDEQLGRNWAYFTVKHLLDPAKKKV